MSGIQFKEEKKDEIRSKLSNHAYQSTISFLMFIDQWEQLIKLKIRIFFLDIKLGQNWNLKL